MKHFSIACLLVAIVIAIPVGIFGKAFLELLDVVNQKQAPTSKPDPIAQKSLAFPVKAWHSVEGFDQNLAVMETVFWDPRDTESLRQLIDVSDSLQGKSVLEIGTGSGLLSLCCLKAGADRVVATDVNPAAIENTKYNSRRFKFCDRLDARLVPLEEPTAYSVVKPEEKFDLIISNPPWVNGKPETIEEYALYDENFGLLKSVFEGLEDHLNPNGRVWMTYGRTDAIKAIHELAQTHQFELIPRDSRELSQLPEEFFPGFVIEIRKKLPAPKEAAKPEPVN